MREIPHCPECDSEYTYVDGVMFVCAECAYEWANDLSLETENDTKQKSEFVKKA